MPKSLRMAVLVALLATVPVAAQESGSSLLQEILRAARLPSALASTVPPRSPTSRRPPRAPPTMVDDPGRRNTDAPEGPTTASMEKNMMGFPPGTTMTLSPATEMPRDVEI